MVHPDILLFNAYKRVPRDSPVYRAVLFTSDFGLFSNWENRSDMYLVDLDYELFKDNSLLRIEDEFQLHFIYEEVPKEKLH